MTFIVKSLEPDSRPRACDGLGSLADAVADITGYAGFGQIAEHIANSMSCGDRFVSGAGYEIRRVQDPPSRDFADAVHLAAADVMETVARKTGKPWNEIDSAWKKISHDVVATMARRHPNGCPPFRLDDVESAILAVLLDRLD